MNEYNQKSIQRVTAISIIGAIFSVVMGFFILSKNINHILSVWGESNKIIVYMDGDAVADLIESTKLRLSKNENVEKVVYFSKERAVEDFNTQIAGYMNGLQNDKALLQVVPSYYEVYLKSEGSLADLNNRTKNLAANIESWIGVDDVSSGSLWTEKYSRLSQSVNAFFIFLGLILFALSFFVISSSIKSHLFQRAKEIEILEMIGATRWYIQRPIFIESFGIISAAFVIGLVANFILYFYFNSFFENQLKLLNLNQVFHFFDFFEILFLLAVSITIGLIVTRLTFRRIYKFRRL